MPAYQNTGSRTAIYPGDQVAVVNNAAVDSAITTTQQLAIGPVGNQSGCTIIVTNTTNQQATGQYAPLDADANYENCSGFIIPAGSALPYNLSLGFVRFTFPSAPTSGSLIVSR
jgi:hypothetical protein